MANDRLLQRIQEVTKAKDRGEPGAAQQLEKLLRKLRERPISHLKQPIHRPRREDMDE